MKLKRVTILHAILIQSEAARELNVKASTIKNYCTTTTKAPNGEIWKYESNGNDII